MKLLSRELLPAERRSAIVLLAAALAAAAMLEPFGGAEIPPAEPALHPPAPRGDWQAGAYAAGSPFDPARRPLGGVGRLPGMGEVAAAPPPPVLLLAGILVEGDRRKAMFSGVGPGTWQEAGSTVGDWLVEAVEPRAVRLRRGGETVVLRSDESLR